jgi:peptidoglycan/LPS O-acetylase OafA/YrhL
VVLGLLLAFMVIGIVASAFSSGRGSIITWSTLGAMGSIGAGFTGAGFLDFNEDVSSFFMAVLALASLLCFVIVLYLPWEDAPPPPISGTASN